jgi:hypothetical protein
LVRLLGLAVRPSKRTKLRNVEVYRGARKKTWLLLLRFLWFVTGGGKKFANTIQRGSILTRKMGPWKNDPMSDSENQSRGIKICFGVRVRKKFWVTQTNTIFDFL